MSAPPRIVIIGAGPTGLGSAWRLVELGFSNWQLLDRSETPGGLASSVVDQQGFTWDLGGHVLFSHYEYFDRLMEELLSGGWVEHVREAWVWMRDRFIPYPVQNNVWRLPPDSLIACLDGLLAVHQAGNLPQSSGTFRDWIIRTFGEGLSEVFMLPYNRKVWAFDPALLDTGWMGERVATVDLRRILRNLVFQRDDCDWGPNATFRFPLRGGTGAIWQALHKRLPPERISLGTQIMEVATQPRCLRLHDATTVNYDFLLSTIPLDCLLRMIKDRPDLSAKADSFKHSSTHIIGVGLDGPAPDRFQKKCWIYFPEPSVPFYRVTVFSNYSPYNVPQPGHNWSLLCEVSESSEKPVNSATIKEDVVTGLHKVGFLEDQMRIASIWHRRLEYGYPTPFLGRDRLLESIDPSLQELGIWSRGRFGGWKYEVSNQDHSLMQGVEAIDRILTGVAERTYSNPAAINAGHKVPLDLKENG
jgi:protoporphyrinogen oxidase